MNENKQINVQEDEIQNWNTFFKYHLHDWYGTVTKYLPSGEILESFRCIRSFIANTDGNEYVQKNYYIYRNGNIECLTFGVKNKPVTKALYIDNNFSWCSKTDKSFTDFRFEIGFRYENKRLSAGGSYKDNFLQHIFIIPESLDGSYQENCYSVGNSKCNNNWQGKVKNIKPYFKISDEIKIEWKSLEDISPTNIVLHFTDNISISCPRVVEAGTEFCVAVDWLAESTLKLRGIRYYNQNGFTLAEFAQFHK